MNMRARDAVVGLVEYQAGNLQSVGNAFEHLGARVRRIAGGTDTAGLTHVVLPGVGAFGFCMQQLRASGMIPFLQDWALTASRPLLGICVGMQLLADRGEEGAGADGLGWAGGVVRRLAPDAPGLRVPHVGWNNVEFAEDFGAIRAGEAPDFYFDHSYAFDAPTQARAVGLCRHGGAFVATLRRDNLVGCQFHPEKSQAAGMRFLEGFLALGRADA
jgi:glutamine amidotransferase